MRFSIVIPTFGRPRRLSEALAAIAALDYPSGEFEVIVVDDGSPEPVEVSLRRMEVILLRQDNAGPASARNAGSRAARGEMLAFLDDDCAPKADWLARMDAAARLHPYALLGGSTRNANPENVFAATNQLLLDTLSVWLRETGSGLRFFPSNNLAVRADLFRTVGGFDASISLAASEDREFSARWLDSGRTLVQVSDAWVNHHHPQTIGSFGSMHFRYGRGAGLLHRRRKSSPWRSVSKGFYRRLIKAAADRPAVVIYMALSQVATAAGYFYETYFSGE